MACSLYLYLLFGMWYLQCCICDLVWCTWYLVYLYILTSILEQWRTRRWPDQLITLFVFAIWYVVFAMLYLWFGMVYLVFGVSLYSHINIGAVEDEKMAWSANHSIWARPAVSPHTIYKHGWIYASHTPYFSVSVFLFLCIFHLLNMHFSDIVWGNSQMFSYLCFFL